MTTNHVPNADYASDVWRRLYDVADDGEAAMLDDLRRRAGITWECYGPGDSDFWHWTNTEDMTHCDSCGLPREVAEVRPSEREAAQIDSSGAPRG